MIQGFNIKTIEDEEIHNQKVILRVDLNLPLDENRNITDDSRIKAILPTLNYLLERGNKIIIITYLGRPKTRDPQFSLDVVAKKLEDYVPGYTTVLADDFMKDTKVLDNQTDKEIIILENIRFYRQEKDNDIEFAKKLAAFGSIFVQDAFAQLHRKEASIVSIPQFLPSFAGFLVKKEVEMISKVINNPSSPFVAIIGGAKIGSKVNLLNKFLEISEFVLVGGALATTLLKAEGFEIGQSLCDNNALDLARNIITKSHKSHAKLLLPQDLHLENGKIVRKDQIQTTDKILDIGPDAQVEFGSIIAQSKTIVWNGPVGYFENPLFKQGTDFIFDAITQNNNAISLIGGGDTLAATANKTNLDKITHISTGGGAMLEFIEKGTLVGLEAIKQN